MSSWPVATGPLLWGRAMVLSAVALSTGAFAHAQAGGLLPGLGALGAIVVCGTLLAAPFLRRPGSSPRIVSLLVAGQSAVHVALAATAGHRGAPVPRATDSLALPAPAPAGRRGSYYDVAYVPTVADHAGGLSVPAPLLHAFTDIFAHPGMALTHLLAAVVCGWWLALGERALWRLLALAARGWSDLLASALRAWAATATAGTVATLRARPFSPRALDAEPRPQLPMLVRSLSRRGPPRTA